MTVGWPAKRAYTAIVKRGRQQTSWSSPGKRRLLVHAAILGAILAYCWTRRRDLGRFLENVRRYSAPDAAIYDAVTAPLLDGFFGQVAGKVAGFAPSSAPAQGRIRRFRSALALFSGSLGPSTAP